MLRWVNALYAQILRNLPKMSEIKESEIMSVQSLSSRSLPSEQLFGYGTAIVATLSILYIYVVYTLHFRQQILQGTLPIDIPWINARFFEHPDGINGFTWMTSYSRQRYLATTPRWRYCKNRNANRRRASCRDSGHASGASVIPCRDETICIFTDAMNGWVVDFYGKFSR